jgi:hypothetical protein
MRIQKNPDSVFITDLNAVPSAYTVMKEREPLLVAWITRAPAVGRHFGIILGWGFFKIAE